MVTADISKYKEIKHLQTSLDHIQAELNLKILKLRSRVRNLRRNSAANDAAEASDRLKGLYISEKEIEDILSAPGILMSSNHTPQKEGFTKEEALQIQQLKKTIEACRKETGNEGSLRLDFLRDRYKLSQFEIDTLLLCLLPEIDPRYQRLYAYLQDDITRKAPSVDLVLRLLCDTPEEVFKSRGYFLVEAPLIKHSLVSLYDDPSSGYLSLPGKSVRLDERITGFLSGQDRVDSRLAAFTSIVRPSRNLTGLAIPGAAGERLVPLIENNRNNPLICCLYGDQVPHKKDIAEAMSSKLNAPMLYVGIKSLISSSPYPDTLIPLVFREGLLQNAVLYLEDFDCLSADTIANTSAEISAGASSQTGKTALAFNLFISEAVSYSRWVILGLEKEWQPEKMITGKSCINLELSDNSYSERLRIWKKLIEDNPEFAADIDAADLAGKFRFSSSRISQAAAAAKNLAKWREPQNGQVNGEDLYAACRKQSGATLSVLARKVQPCYGWEDIVLPADQKEQLHEICAYAEHYHTVYDSWGFGRKLSLGKGLKALFAGPSGTGKTMAADVIAGELKIDLYKIDLSTIVSKYIGETEKNLDKIFREGQTSNAILFFDEADALFGKRSEVRDAHDRYANIETAYLLQKMDEYEGMVILATNLRKNMDEAFARRMHFTLEFPLPEENDRLRIWRQVFPPESPLEREIDFPFLARQFKISGGNIKNIALGAAFLAAANGRVINMEHLIKAAKREYQKIGKLCTENDFGRYFDLVKT